MLRLKMSTDTVGVDRLCLHPESAEALGLHLNTVMKLRYGIRDQLVSIDLSTNQEVNEVRLSRAAMQKLKIPRSSLYEFVIKDNEIIIGPYLGFLVTHRLKNLRAYLKNLSDYLRYYQNIGGTVLAFALEGVDPSTQTIRGYIFNPITRKWEMGRYPYPASIFIRGDIRSNRWCRHFKSVIGNNIFNDFYLNKWEMHKLLCSFTHIQKLVPDTVLYEKPSDVRTFLRSYPHAYIKPINGTMGISIIKVSKTASGILVEYRQAGRNKKVHLANDFQAKAFFSNRLRKGKYIIQQALELISYRRKLIDFRLIVVKNGGGEWEYMGMVARYGAEKSIISNISADGTAEDGKIALQKALRLTRLEALQFENHMAEVAIDIAKSIETAGLHFANTGIDFGIDQNRKLWMIEVQHSSPAHSIALDAGNVQMYRQILRNNMVYLKRLAGFSES